MPRPIIVASTILAAFVLGACGNQDSKASDVRDVLKDAGASTSEAECASEKIDAELTQDEMNELAKSEKASDIPDDIDEKITPALDECLGEGASTDSSTDDGSSSEDGTEIGRASCRERVSKQV